MNQRVTATILLALGGLGSAAAATISGQVIDRNTLAPIAGATVTLYAAGAMGMPTSIAQTQADANGHYTITTNYSGNRLAGVARAASYAARAQDDGTCYQDLACLGVTTLQPIAPGDSATFEFRLAPAARISGRLRDSVDNQAPTAATVTLTTFTQPANHYTIGIGSDGRFVVDGLPAGSYELRTQASGSDADRPNYLNLVWPNTYCDDVQVLCAALNAPFVVNEGQQVGELDFPLRQGSYLRTRLISDGTGQPVDQRTNVVQAQTLQGTASGSTLPDGYARIGPLLPGQVKLELRPAVAAAYPAMGWPNLPCSSNPCDLGAATAFTVPASDGLYTLADVHVLPLRSVRGRVIDAATAQPIAGISLAAGQVDGLPAGTFVARAAAVTDANGEYRLEGFGDSSTLVRTLPNGHGYIDRAWQNIECNGQNLFCTEAGVAYTALNFATDAHPAQIDFALQRAASLQGRVIRAGSGEPQVNFRIIVLPAGNPRMVKTVATDAAGQFRIDSLSPDTYYLFGAPAFTVPRVISGFVYPQLPCWFDQNPAPHCDLALATPFTVGYGGAISGIEFVLPGVDPIFAATFD